MRPDAILHNSTLNGVGTQRIQPPPPPKISDGPSPGGRRADSASFSDTLLEAMDRVNSAELSADRATRDLAAGRSDDVLGAAMAAEKASLAMNTALRIRSDALDAYEQIMRMPL